MGLIKNILKMSAVAIIVPGIVLGAQQSNPRSTVNNARNVARSADAESDAAVRRSATSVIARSTVLDKRQSRPVVTARPATVRATTVRSVRPVAKGSGVARNASKSSVVRSGTKIKNGGVNVSRAGTARATAVFSDVSKIGGGYSSCRDAYATCMDQMCANANDTYRRCFCSDRFTEFRDLSDRLDEALKLLAEFQNVNLDAVNKTAAEVEAMYSATEGEAAIKRDTSASQKLLDSISEVLSAKTKKTSSSSKKSSYTTSSLGTLDLAAFSTVADDPFGGSSSFNNSLASAFSNSGSSSYTDISSLEGADLYDGAMNQCSQITRESCGGDAMFNLARSAYSILITQDCNAYEKSIAAKKTSVEDTVRKAEKYLREARLEEYRAHNSADMNECLTAVDNAMRQQFACGPNLEGCLDFTGLYISSTGEPVYSQAFFGLNNVIVLNGTADVLSGNQSYLQEFEKRKKSFAESALNTCRSIADEVWEEYKRMLLIQVAQAQDDKIEEVKASCVQTIKTCYDTQTGAMNSLAEDVSDSSVKAISAIAARDACKEKVFACAALYWDVNGCSYDDSTKKISTVSGKKCGMQSLLALVDTVDTVRFEKGCEEALREYAQDTCAPAAGDTHAYPWGCVRMSPDEVESMLAKRAETVCASDFGSDYNMNDVIVSGDSSTKTISTTVNKKYLANNQVQKMDSTTKLTAQSQKVDTVAQAQSQKADVMVQSQVVDATLSANNKLVTRAATTTKKTSTSSKYGGKLDLKSEAFVSKIMDEIKRDMTPMLRDECLAIEEEGDLVFDDNGFSLSTEDTINVSPTWMRNVFGTLSVQALVNTGLTGYGLNVRGDIKGADSNKRSLGWGVCMQPSVRQFCAIQNQMPDMSGTAVFENGECKLTDDWYKNRCQDLGGYMSGDNCYIK